MEITILGFVLGLLLLAIPAYLIYYLHLGMMRRLFMVVGKMMAVMVSVGVFMGFVIRLNNVWISILSAVLSVVLGSVLSIGKAKLSMKRLIVPMIAGMLLPTLLISVYFLFLVLGIKNVLEAQYFIPFVALIVGCGIGANAKALHAYYMGLLHHNQLYYYLLGNGSTHRKAVSHFVRRGFQAAALSVAKDMSGVVISTAPAMMLVMVMSGVGMATAVSFQILFYVMVLALVMSSLFITLRLSRRFTFDEYEKLRSVTTRPATKAAPPPTVSTSSSSLSEPLRTDFESLPQEEAPETHPLA